MSVAQVVVSGAVLFVLYRYLLATIGVEQIGIWSIVLAITAASRISELGLSGSVVKFVAKFRAHADSDTVSVVIQTAAISVCLLIGGMLIIVYPFLAWVLERIVPANAFQDALSVLPYAVVSLWITAISGVFQSGLYGCQRIDLSSCVPILSSLTRLLLALLLVPTYGLLGLAFGQVIQAAAALLASWILLRRELTILPAIPYRWHRALFIQMTRYGVNFQIISITGMLFDPMTKALLGKFGGLADLGYYDMAHRMIMQFRALIVSTNQVMVPIIASLQETTPEQIQSVYKDAYRVLLYFALPFYAGVMGATPIVSELWIGHYEKTFIIFSLLLTTGVFLNTLIGPAYFANIGTGRLHWNTLAHITIGVLNGGLGFVFGMLFGSVGVVVGWVIAFVTGSSIVVVAYHLEHHIPASELMPKENRWLTVGAGAGAASGLLIYFCLHEHVSTLLLSMLSLLVFVAAVFLPFWHHPMRIRLMKWLTDNLQPVKPVYSTIMNSKI